MASRARVTSLPTRSAVFSITRAFSTVACECVAFSPTRRAVSSFTGPDASSAVRAVRRCDSTLARSRRHCARASLAWPGSNFFSSSPVFSGPTNAPKNGSASGQASGCSSADNASERAYNASCTSR
eukprot:7385672-Prymnesium_polylepis.1